MTENKDAEEPITCPRLYSSKSGLEFRFVKMITQLIKSSCHLLNTYVLDTALLLLFWLHWVLIVACGLSLAVAHGLLLLWTRGSSVQPQ